MALPKPISKKRIETTDKKEASRLKKLGFTEKQISGTSFVLEKRLEKWEVFQERVGVLLEALGFEDIAVGQSSWLGRYQIDVVGGYDGTFLVFECKSSNEPKLKKLTTEINIFSGKKAELLKAIKEKFGQKYSEIRFVLAIDDIEISEKDEETARENDVFLWGSSYLQASGEIVFTNRSPSSALSS